MQKQRASRLTCRIDVFACTTIEIRPAQIIDLSRLGAKLRLSEPYPAGAAILIDVDGDYYRGEVTWSKSDRMGLRFRVPVAAGALHARLLHLQALAARAEPRSVGFGRRRA